MQYCRTIGCDSAMMRKGVLTHAKAYVNLEVRSAQEISRTTMGKCDCAIQVLTVRDQK